MSIPSQIVSTLIQRGRNVAGMLFFFALPVAALGSRSDLQSNRHCDVEYSLHTFDFSAHQVRIEVYSPKTAGKYPLIILVHGSAGTFSLNGTEVPERENFGERSIAERCFVTAL